MPTSTFGLVERIRAGDREAFTVLFHKYSPRLGVLIHYRLGPAMRGRVEMDDILQETFLNALRQFPGFTYRNPGSFMNWLARIAEHVIVDCARYHGRQKRGPSETVALRTESNPGGVEPVEPTTPSRIFASRERYEHMVQRLEALPDEYRSVIIMAKVECLSTQEIADRLGRTRASVAVLLHRAVQRLRKTEAPSEPS
jgi:RNA polymerase sigma-70 factor (ECF subfamily)